MAKKQPAAQAAADEDAAPEQVVAYKAFNADWTCRGMQYELGKTATHDGPVEACSSGLHACENPIDMLRYYAPATSRFAVVRASGKISRHAEDSKIAAASLMIEAEIGIPTIVAKTIEWVLARCTPEGEIATGYSGAASATGNRGAASATGDSGAASATGNSGAASATGYSGAASATGNRGAASATGDSGAASATGDSGAASATGDSGAASATGNRGAASATGNSGAASATGDSGAASATGAKSTACASGRSGRALAIEGGAIFLCYRDSDWNIVHARGTKVGDNGVKANTWYSLDEAGEFVEVQ